MMFQFFELFMAKTTFSQICTTKHNVFTPISSLIQMFSHFSKKLGEILCGYHLLSILNIPNIPQVREIGWPMIIYHLRCFASFESNYFLGNTFCHLGFLNTEREIFFKGDINQIRKICLTHKAIIYNRNTKKKHKVFNSFTNS